MRSRAEQAVELQCPELSSLQLSELEARARADLYVAGHSDGRLTVTCTGKRATAVLRTARGEYTATAERDSLLDGAFEAITKLSEIRAAQESPPNLAVSPATSGVVPLGDRGDQAPSPPPSRPTEGIVGDRGSARTESDTGSQTRLRASLLAGGHISLWSGDTFGALGPRAGASLRVTRSLSLELFGSLAWTPSEPKGVGARSAQASLQGVIELTRDPELVLGVGVLAGKLWVTSDVDRSPSVRTAALYGMSLDLLYVARPAKALFLRLGPSFALHTRDVIVELDDEELFRVPAFTVGALTELGWSL